MSNELLKDIAELRRNMPRNHTAMRVCDALEESLTQKRHVGFPELDRITVTYPDGSQEVKFDKKAYQRDYMRKRREKEKANV